jgi:hypothetical protein
MVNYYNALAHKGQPSSPKVDPVRIAPPGAVGCDSPSLSVQSADILALEGLDIADLRRLNRSQGSHLSNGSDYAALESHDWIRGEHRGLS